LKPFRENEMAFFICQVLINIYCEASMIMSVIEYWWALDYPKIKVS